MLIITFGENWVFAFPLWLVISVILVWFDHCNTKMVWSLYCRICAKFGIYHEMPQVRSRRAD